MQIKNTATYTDMPPIVQKLREKFGWVFGALSIEVPPAKIIAMSELIYEAMAMRTRSFHTPNHIFEVSENATPLETLAALFHDTVYFNVDEEFPGNIWSRISPYIATEKTALHLKVENFKQDPVAMLAIEIFGLGDKVELVDFSGPNEFLSALLMIAELRSLLSEPQLATVLCCIEATIPFRNSDSTGLMPAEALGLRLQKINQERHWRLSEGDLDEIMRMAVRLGNKDIDNFAIADPGLFLDNTWKLMPETNPHLRTPDLYTVRDYRIALQRMESFLSALNPKTVFHSYKDYPDRATIEHWTQLTTNNVETTLTYVRAKLVTITILESLAELTGGNVPIAYFMGDLSKHRKKMPPIEDFLPDRKTWKRASDINRTTEILLEGGRKTDIWFDLKNAPLSHYVYVNLGNAQVVATLEIAKQLFQKQISSEKFLERISPTIVSSIALACSKTAKTRGTSLEKLANAMRVETKKAG